MLVMFLFVLSMAGRFQLVRRWRFVKIHSGSMIGKIIHSFSMAFVPCIREAQGRIAPDHNKGGYHLREIDVQGRTRT